MIYFWPTFDGFAVTDDYAKIPEKILAMGMNPLARRSFFRTADSIQEFQDYVERECIPVAVHFDIQP